MAYLYVERDLKTDRPNYAELKKWLSVSGLSVKRFFNTSGVAYKSLSLKEKLPSMSDDECLKLLASDGMLVKRPLLIGDTYALVGLRKASGKKKRTNLTQ
jgi:arsenate reductase